MLVLVFNISGSFEQAIAVELVVVVRLVVLVGELINAYSTNSTNTTFTTNIT